MRLSEAMVLGRTLVDKPNGGCYACCALGMAARAVGLEVAPLDRTIIYHHHMSWTSAKRFIEDEWPWLLGQPNAASAERSVITNYTDEISYRFLLGQSIDTIADYVRSVEPADVANEPATEAAVESQKEEAHRG